MHGERGTLQYEEDKRKYVGGFKSGAKHGTGEYYFPNGSRCVRVCLVWCVCGVGARDVRARGPRTAHLHPTPKPPIDEQPSMVLNHPRKQ